MVFILQQILPKYRYDILKNLKNSDFKVLYSDVIKEKSLKSYRPQENQFIEVPIFRLGEKYIQAVLPCIFKLKPHTIIYTPELRNFTFWLLLVLKPIFKYSLVAWSHGINNKDFFSGRLSVQSKLRIFMMRLSDQVITYSEDRASALEKILDKKIYFAKNTLNTNVLNDIYQNLKLRGVDSIKKELNVDSKINIIFVGRIIKDKEIEKSLVLFNQIQKEFESIAFNIVGDGPDLEQLKSFVKEEQINGVRFLGAINNPELLGKWLYISDLHFHLGYVGLAVVHSLCFETPIVTLIPDPKEGPFHSPEYSYLNKNNSVITKVDETQNKITELLKMDEKLLNLKKNARNTFESECEMNQFLKTFEGFR